MYGRKPAVSGDIFLRGRMPPYFFRGRGFIGGRSFFLNFIEGI